MSDIRGALRRWQNLLGLGIVLVFCGIAAGAPLIAPLPEVWQGAAMFIIPGLRHGLPLAPGVEGILGTVAVGGRMMQIDVFYTLIWGTRSALIFGVTAAALTALVGVSLGALSAFLGGWADRVIMRVSDAFLAFPVIAGVILFVQMLSLIRELSFYTSGTLDWGEPTKMDILFQYVDPVLMALIIFSWMPYTRITHGLVLRIKETEFIHAARALGASPGRIIFRHLIPNSIGPAIVLATSQVGGMVLLQAALNFIGLNAGSMWGAVLAIGRRWMLGSQGNPLTYWWVFVPITIVLVLFGIGWSLLGDGINDMLNPRLNSSAHF